MARNAPKAPTRATDETSATSTNVSDDQNPHDPDAGSDDVEGIDTQAEERGPAMKGGAAGFSPEASRTIHPSPEEILERAKANAEASPFASDKQGVKPREYRVLAEKNVLFAGSLTRLKHGSVYKEHEVDIPALRRQGVQLEQISGPPEEE